MGLPARETHDTPQLPRLIPELSAILLDIRRIFRPSESSLDQFSEKMSTKIRGA